jgi:hypothetical protein
MDEEDDVPHERPRWLRPFDAVAARMPFFLPALLVPVVVAAAVLAAPRTPTSEAATVRGFLDAAVVNHDGETACSYLTAAAREEFEQHDKGPTCTQFFAASDLPGVQSDRQVKQLSETVRGDSVSVDGLKFDLRPGVGVTEFRPPPEAWRIESFSSAAPSRDAGL